MTPWTVIQWCIVIVCVIGTIFVVALAAGAAWGILWTFFGELWKKDVRRKP